MWIKKKCTAWTLERKKNVSQRVSVTAMVKKTSQQRRKGQRKRTTPVLDSIVTRIVDGSIPPEHELVNLIVRHELRGNESDHFVANTHNQLSNVIPFLLSIFEGIVDTIYSKLERPADGGPPPPADGDDVL